MTQSEDGRHLLKLWELRQSFYPKPAAGLLDRFVHDALAHGVDPAEGHRACNRYRIEDTIGSITAPTLLLGASEDGFAMPNLPELQNNLVNASVPETVVVSGGKVAFLEAKSAEIAVIDTLSQRPQHFR